MFGFFKKKKDDKPKVDENKAYLRDIGAVEAAKITAQDSIENAANKFAKPAQYTGNRKLYDDGRAKFNAKAELFKEGKVVRDPYTGEQLTLTVKEAKRLYGSEWQKHLAESDHTWALEKIVKETSDSPWLTVEDQRAAANSPENMTVMSRKTNNAKRSRTNKEYVEDRDYRESKGVKFTKKGEEAALRDGEMAERAVHSKLSKASAINMAKTFHGAGIDGARGAAAYGGALSGISNVVALIKGEKKADEVIVDIAGDTAKAAATGYVTSGALTVVSHTLTNSGSKFLSMIAKSNLPANILTSVMVLGGSMKDFAQGKISTRQFLLDVGDRGLTFATSGYSMAIGQAIIPVPILGAAIGAFVGASLTSGWYQSLVGTLRQQEIEYQERLRIIEECRQATAQIRAFRLELESYLKDYFKDYQDCFDEALSELRFSFQAGDADGVIAGANKITEKLGGKVYYNNMKEFKEFFNSDEIDVI